MKLPLDDVNEEAIDVGDTYTCHHTQINAGLLKEGRLILQYKDQFQGYNDLHKYLIATGMFFKIILSARLYGHQK